MNEDKLSILQDIETALKEIYDGDLELTDTLCVLSLENARIAFKQKLGFSKNEQVTDSPYAQEIIESCVKIGLTLVESGVDSKEYLRCLEKVKNSVKRHSEYGPRGYYEFVKKYV